MTYQRTTHNGKIHNIHKKLRPKMQKKHNDLSVIVLHYQNVSAGFQ